MYERSWMMEPVILEQMTVISALLVEHRMLRALMEQMGAWLQADVPPEALRERAVVIAFALESHADWEEQHLFAPLRSRSDTARHLIDMMELVHTEVHDLFQEVQTEQNPRMKLWTILEMTK